MEDTLSRIRRCGDAPDGRAVPDARGLTRRAVDEESVWVKGVAWVDGVFPCSDTI